MAGIEVMAIVRSGRWWVRNMTTTVVLKGEAKDKYYYVAPLVNPIPNSCCVEVKSSTDYLVFAGNGDEIGYSICGSNGIQQPIEYENGSPPFAFFYAYPYLEGPNKEKIIELLATHWPEVRAKWIDNYKSFVESQKYSYIGRNFGASDGEGDPESAEQRGIEARDNLKEAFQHILYRWNPVVVEESVNSPYSSARERKEIKAASL
jgi:hypothetical protein